MILGIHCFRVEQTGTRTKRKALAFGRGKAIGATACIVRHSRASIVVVGISSSVVAPDAAVCRIAPVESRSCTSQLKEGQCDKCEIDHLENECLRGR